MSPTCFLDTNILLYAISQERQEAPKQQRALALLDRDDVGLSVQVLQEFYVQATRASRDDALPHDIAAGLVHAWTRFPVQVLTLGVLTHAMEIKAGYRLSYWDSAILAAAIALGCDTVLSEDLRHGQQVETLRIVNPFR